MEADPGAPRRRSAVRSATLTGELLASYFAGNRESERRLFEQECGDLLKRARSHRLARSLRRHASPEELVNEVFLRVLGSGKLLEFIDCETGSLRRYLSGKLDDVCRDMCRRVGAEKRGGGREPASIHQDNDGESRPEFMLTSGGATPTSDAREKELSELVRGLLGTRDWEIWRRCELEGESSVEIAREIGGTDASVRGVLHRARQKVVLALADRLTEGSSCDP